MSVCPCCGQPIKPPPKKRAWSKEDDDWLRGAIKAGWKHADIAEALGRPISSIGSRLRTLDGAIAVSIDAEPDELPKKSIEQRPGVRIITHRIA